MATIPYLLPQWASFNNTSPNQVPYYPAPGAIWREGDVLIQSTTGTMTQPPNLGLGTFVGQAGPAASRVTFTAATTAGAPAATYYIQVTDAYSGGNESIPSQEFIVNSQAGQTPIVAVSATGAPTNATSFNVYAARYPGMEGKQNSSITAYASTVTLASPLTNSIGVNKGATAAAANIVGIAVNDSTQNYFIGGGGSILVGNQSILGATNSLPPLTPPEVLQAYVIKLQNGTYWEFSLRTTIPWYPSLVGSSVGLYLDATTGFWVVDTAQTAVATIYQSSDGVNSICGTVGDIGKRVIVTFTGTGLV